MTPSQDHISKRLVLSLGFIVCLAICSVAQPPESPSDSGLGGIHSIIGNVFLPSGMKVDRRLRVRLYSMTRGDVTTTTDSNGNFAFRGLVYGNYTVAIDGEKDLEAYRQQVEIIEIRGMRPSPQTYSLNIRLKPAKTAPGPKPGVIDADLAVVPPPALKLFEKAGSLSNEGAHPAAIDELQLAIKEYPGFWQAYDLLGVEYLQLNQLVNAGEAFRSALRIKSDAFVPMYHLGVTLYRLKDFAGAETVLREAVKLDDKSAKAHFFLGETIAYSGKFEEAEKELLYSLTLGGDSMKEAHRHLAIIYGSRGDKKRQLVELEDYLRLAPNAPDAEQLRILVQQLKDPK